LDAISRPMAAGPLQGNPWGSQYARFSNGDKEPGISAPYFPTSGEKTGPGKRRGLWLLSGTYQLSRSPHWNCRGSKAALGAPAGVYKLFPSATLNRLMKLNMSTIPSSLALSLKLIVLAIRISVKTVLGRVPAFRPRLPFNVPLNTPS